MEKASKTNQSVEKVLQIIEVMADSKGPLRLQDIAQRTEIPAATALRLVNTLVEKGYAFQDQNTLRYGLTLQLARIGSQIRGQISLRDCARPIMEQLAAHCREACCLAVEENAQVVYIELVDGPDNILRIMQYIGKRAPMYCTGIGKLLLLNKSEQEIRQLLERTGMKRYTDNTLTTPEALLRELEQVRRQGWAMDNEECELGARCVAASVRDYTGRIIGGISISGPTTRLTMESLSETAQAVKRAGDQISRQMGWQPQNSD